MTAYPYTGKKKYDLKANTGNKLSLLRSSPDKKYNLNPAVVSSVELNISIRT